MSMFDQGSDARHDKYFSARLLNAQTGTNAVWEWHDIRAFEGPASLDVTGIGTGTIEIRVSNANIQPADDAVERIFGSALTANALTAVVITARWVAARKTVAGDSTATTVILHKAGHAN